MLSYRGVPQIEVTFDIDVNGILQVTVADNAAKKSNKITITKEKGLSEEQIKRMVEEAEDDKRVQERVNSRNKLKNYINNMTSSIKDNDRVASKLGSGH